MTVVFIRSGVVRSIKRQIKWETPLFQSVDYHGKWSKMDISRYQVLRDMRETFSDVTLEYILDLQRELHVIVR